MLFILVMDVLNSLIHMAYSSNLLMPLAGQCSWPRISLYAGDVVIFVKPELMDLSVVRDLLQCFGAVTGLKTNPMKSSVTPSSAQKRTWRILQKSFSCSVGSFPCSYLGTPFTIQKPSKADLLPLIDKVSSKLLGWKAPLLSKVGRLVVVKSVLSATPIHLMIALDLPKWVIRLSTLLKSHSLSLYLPSLSLSTVQHLCQTVQNSVFRRGLRHPITNSLKSMDKRRRGFLSKGQEQANGGNCMVSWAKVQQPYLYGGLGVHDLERMGWALRMRWLWFMKADASRPWAGLPVQIPSQAKAFFEMAVEITVGNGENTKFWTDRWLHDKRVADLAPNLLRAIPKRVAKRRTMNIKGALTVQVLVEYLHISELLEGVVLQPYTPDTPVWRLSSSGFYNSKSAYEAMFVGTIKFSPWKRMWKTWAPANCRFFIWLAINNRCWTSDRLAKRGLPHQPACPFCDQA
ncbi:hypothetical protein U9M48_028497 [Paspalum notatum var. saurae]|uniref:Reverse transcriptase zinc-binding domain-containing protein n=1 Tax=Paspalum notatum var. saurae TaxID=547442 RepID=A0AAQ3X086_PASNO